MAATFTQTSTVFHTLFARAEHALSAVVTRGRSALRRRAAYNKIRNELRTYSDRGLADIGITAGDIDRIAREGSRDL